jgi:hypothetical protein
VVDPRPDRRRSFLTPLWFLGGFVLTMVGLVLSARVGTESFLDPVLVGSPVVFVVGLVLVATTGAVYELLP